MEEVIDKLDFIKINKFCVVRVNVKRRQTTDWEKIFAKGIADKGLLSKYKELLKLNNKKTNNPFNKTWSDTKEDIQMANKGMKRRLTCYIIREWQIKTTMRYHSTPTRFTKNPNHW